MIERRAVSHAVAALARSPAVALLGPRQVGKTTLAVSLADHYPGATYLDLERPADARRLSDPDAYLRSHVGSLVVIDEVHRAPGLFEVLRGVIDHARREGHRTGGWLLLGSASPALIGMASETLAGRLATIDLAPIDPLEAVAGGRDWREAWLRGGFPESLLARDDAESVAWRQDFIRSYLERDVPMFAPRVPATTVGRLWQMLAHSTTGTLNASGLASGLGVSGPTVSRYVELLVDLGLVRLLPPWHANAGKRLVRRPKVLVRDTGLLHALLDLESQDQLLGHPIVGASFETLVIETCLALTAGTHRPHFYRTSHGAEIDLLLVRGGVPDIAIEVKLSSAPVPSAHLYRSSQELGVRRTLVVYPGSESYPLKDGVEAVPLSNLADALTA